MKKLFNATIALALSSMLFFSCSKSDDVVVKNEDVLVKATLIAGNPQADPGTKTEIQGTTPYWSVGDAVGVTNGVSTNAEFTSSITSPSTTATFSGETVSGDLFAYYPYSTAGVGTSGASIVLPAEQNPTATSFDGRADVLVFKMFTVDPENTTVSGLEFKRLTAAVKVVFKDNTGGSLAGEHPTFVSLEAGSNLIGSVLVNFAGQSMSVQSGATKVTANYTASTQYAIDGTNGAYFVVFPQTLASGTTLTVKANTENYYIEKNITIPSSGIEILEGKITTLNIGLGAAHVTHHPVINVTSAPSPVVYTATTGNTIGYEVQYPDGGIFTAESDVTWISNISYGSGVVTFDVAAQPSLTYSSERTGNITLKYPGAEDVVVAVSQSGVYDLTPVTGTSSSHDANANVAVNGITWNVQGKTNQTPWELGGAHKFTGDRAITSIGYINFNVGKIVITHGNDNLDHDPTMSVIVATDTAFNNVVSNLTPTFVKNGSITVSRPAAADWTNCYYKIVYHLSLSKGQDEGFEFSRAFFTSF